MEVYKLRTIGRNYDELLNFNIIVLLSKIYLHPEYPTPPSTRVYMFKMPCPQTPCLLIKEGGN